MKKLGSAILCCALCFLSFTLLRAQNIVTTFIAPTATVPPSTIYKADFKVLDFKRILGLQFALRWDPTVLRFKAARQFTLATNPQLENFGTTEVANGMLIIQWFDETLQGRGLEDSTTLFSIEYEVIGNPNSTTQLSFTDSESAKREVADVDERVIDANYHTGIISIALPTDVRVFNSAPHLIQVEDSFPNPFHEVTQIQFTLQKPVQAHLMIQNMQGQVVYEEKRAFASGAHTLQLSKELFPASGNYQYSIITADFVVTQKLSFF